MKASLQDRLDKCSTPEPFSGCILWTGGVNAAGYGRICFNGRDDRAHRASFILRYGKIPPGLELDHLCSTPLCINPDHLEAVTHAENNRRFAAKITHCPSGHKYTEENTIKTPAPNFRGYVRKCRACDKARKASKQGAKP